jgi:8-amino-7-oxononanoate synthase
MWRDRINERLSQQRQRGLFRSSRAIDGAPIDLTTNDYLALGRHPALAAAIERAARDLGAGAGASRLAGGTMPIHERVEARFAALKGAERALLMPTGYHANLALLTALPSPGDLICCDKRCHASLIDGARLATAMHAVTLRTYAHNDAGRASELADRHLAQAPESTVWLVTDSVFSMDGDTADLPALARVRDSFDGRACLITDEAHATGILGPDGAGLDARFGHPSDIVVSTASKALGSLGGIVSARAIVCEAIENFARAFIYTTAVPPTQAAAIDAALDVIRDEPERRERLATISRRLRSGLRAQGWPVAPFETDPTPIVPLVVGESEMAIGLSMRLRDAGFAAPAIRPPTVAPGSSRVRLSLHADLTDDQIDRLLAVLVK